MLRTDALEGFAYGATLVIEEAIKTISTVEQKNKVQEDRSLAEAILSFSRFNLGFSINGDELIISTLPQNVLIYWSAILYHDHIITHKARCSTKS